MAYFILLFNLFSIGLPVVQAKDTALISPDGRFRWKPGERRLTVFNTQTGRIKRHLRLPPISDTDINRRVLFSKNGLYFCLIDERRSEIGLHLKSTRGARAAKAWVVQSTLYLIDQSGRILWKKRLRDGYAPDIPTESNAPHIAADGTLAILLQDPDALHVNPRPLLIVFDPKGKQRLRLDYIDWRRIDEFELSPNGWFLATRGFGRLKEEEDWGYAYAIYSTRSKKQKMGEGEPADSSENLFTFVEDNGTACCMPSLGRHFILDINNGILETPMNKE